MAAGVNEKDRARLHEICGLSYKAQAIWFLNGFWEEYQSEAEKFWAYVTKANVLDIEKHDSGNALDELNAHRLLEIFDETLTVREMRTQLRSVGAIDEKEHPKLVPLAHLLLARYKVDWHHFVNAPQGNDEDLKRAQEKLNECKAAFEASNARASEAAAALRAASEAEASAKERETAAAQRAAASAAAAADLAAKEEELRAAQAALDAALAEVQREEEAYNAKTAELKAKSETGGVVSMNRAKNELAQHLAEDPLPLRKAKITAEAAAKRNERAIAQAREAVLVAEQAAAAAAAAAQEATAARRQAEAARAASERAKEAADAALAHAEAALQEAEAYLVEVQKNASGGKGALWWIERELHEQRKYLPTSRGGIAK